MADPKKRDKTLQYILATANEKKNKTLQDILAIVNEKKIITTSHSLENPAGIGDGVLICRAEVYTGISSINFLIISVTSNKIIGIKQYSPYLNGPWVPNWYNWLFSVLNYFKCQIYIDENLLCEAKKAFKFKFPNQPGNSMMMITWDHKDKIVIPRYTSEFSEF